MTFPVVVALLFELVVIAVITSVFTLFFFVLWITLSSYFISLGYIVVVWIAFLFTLVSIIGSGNHRMPTPEKKRKRKEKFVVIIGAGFSGLCAAIRLKKERVRFILIEKSGDLGGTWLDNKYPGSGCDIYSLFYCFSFKPNTFSSSTYLSQEEIKSYLDDTCDHYGIREHMKFNSKVERCHFDDVTKTWKVETSTGDEYMCNFIVSGIGALHIPQIPDIKGKVDFQGLQFHTAQWNTEFDWTGKRVGVIGTGCSAIQSVPKLADSCKELHVFQRSPTWIIPMLKLKHYPLFQNCLHRFPIFMQLFRAYIFLRQELLFKMVFKRGSNGNKLFQKIFTWVMKQQIADESLQQHLVPQYEVGSKRIAISNSYLATFNKKDKVHLVTGKIVEITSNSIVVIKNKDVSSTSSKVPGDTLEEIELDAIVYATGFDVLNSLKNVDIKRPGDHKSLQDLWEDLPNAYQGLMVPGFPNYFMLMGPSTVLGKCVWFSVRSYFR